LRQSHHSKEEAKFLKMMVTVVRKKATWFDLPRSQSPYRPYGYRPFRLYWHSMFIWWALKGRCSSVVSQTRRWQPLGCMHHNHDGPPSGEAALCHKFCFRASIYK
jgi:hypothetical protein